MSYASGKEALAICDICGFECPYTSLQDIVRSGHVTGIRACQDCFDPDHPQSFIGTVKADDAIGLQNPRTDRPVDPYRSFFGWSPIGNELTSLTASVGDVTVSTG